MLDIKKIRQAWKRRYPNYKMWPTQELMLKSIAEYQKSPHMQYCLKEKHQQPEMLQLGLGMRSGATTLLRAIKDTTDSVVSVSLTHSLAETCELNFGNFITGFQLCSPKNKWVCLQDKIVIFDCSLFWYPRKAVEIVRLAETKYIMALGG